MTKEKNQTTIKKTKRVNKNAPVRLWVKAKFVGFRRSKVQQNTNQCLLKVQGLNDKGDSSWYLGKRVVYIFKAHNKDSKTKSKFRTIWGKVCKAHGNNGQVIARFRSNLPPRAIGSTLRVMLYPNRA